ncbi:l-1-G0334 [Drosophila busckii]|uniref:Pyruvate dehydrogenase E1 component subunit alpha n=1 Tax=Drosophila busckii TaxID=30019 RepID=A0A0M5IYU8_DROBS|nr:pyruvate dehydrogenase E1 component subunit alpha, mitochondrial [Drosophila busckii]ALC40186.1 l-1-G0334 [Drosophila busckii]
MQRATARVIEPAINQLGQLLQRLQMHTAVEQPCPRPSPVEDAAEEERSLDAEDLRVLHLAAPFKLHRLEHGPDTLVVLKLEQAKRYYRQLLALRRLEAAAAQLYKERQVRGFCHLYTGQEACAVGLCAALREQDNLIGGYRIHGYAYLMGVSAVGVLAELTGKCSGCARGKGGSMHMYAPHFYGGNGIVGAQVPLGAGIALASKYRNEDAVCFALYGDGAANQGQIFECFNMAQLWQLPLVFVCENNHYGMGTSIWRSTSNTSNYKRGDELPGIWVDGQDVLAVRSAAQFAIDHARRHGPLVLELCTYRYAGHSMSDPGTNYRKREEVQRVRRSQDAVERFGTLCQQQALLSKSEMLAIEQEVRDEVQQATKVAIGDAELPLYHLWSDVYASSLLNKIRGISEHNLRHDVT